jgi:hypothetical protein
MCVLVCFLFLSLYLFYFLFISLFDGSNFHFPSKSHSKDLNEGTTILGRQNAELHLSDLRVSRRHASIEVNRTTGAVLLHAVRIWWIEERKKKEHIFVQNL